MLIPSLSVVDPANRKPTDGAGPNKKSLGLPWPRISGCTHSRSSSSKPCWSIRRETAPKPYCMMSLAGDSLRRVMAATTQQIDDLHDRLGEMETFSRYVRALKSLGVETYDSYLTDGHSEYFGLDGYTVKSPAAHEKLSIAETSRKS